MQKIVFGVGVFVVVFLLVGLFLPATSRFVVSAEIDAPPATVFALVNDMRRRQLWSSINASDPNARIEFSGAARGVGASVSWNGAVAGSGTETIVESRAFDYVESLINAGEPGEARSWFEIALGASGSSVVRRGFEHAYGFNLVGRYFGLFVTGVLRRDYEAGLARLKDAAESLPRTDFSDLEIDRLRVEPLDIAYVQVSSPPNPAQMSRALGDAYAQVLDFIDREALTVAGAPLSITRSFSGAELRFDAGIPVRGVDDATRRDHPRVRIGRSYGGTVLRVSHTGSYDRLAETHRKISAYLAATGIERNGDAWESYVTDPAEVDSSELLTYIYYPVSKD